jgi:hypothetical protein
MSADPPHLLRCSSRCLFRDRVAALQRDGEEGGLAKRRRVDAGRSDSVQARPVTECPAESDGAGPATRPAASPAEDAEFDDDDDDDDDDFDDDDDHNEEEEGEDGSDEDDGEDDDGEEHIEVELPQVLTLRSLFDSRDPGSLPEYAWEFEPETGARRRPDSVSPVEIASVSSLFTQYANFPVFVTQAPMEPTSSAQWALYEETFGVGPAQVPRKARRILQSIRFMRSFWRNRHLSRSTCMCMFMTPFALVDLSEVRHELVLGHAGNDTQ